MNVYNFDDYLVFLSDVLQQNKGNRGFHARLAEAAGMHPSYLSRILHGSIHLTPDQAAGLCDFWGFNRDEAHYFLGLVNLARAGSPALKKILKAEIQSLKEKQEDLGERLPAEKMDLQKENLYYSAWYNCAVHVLLTIPGFRTETAISEKLLLPKDQARKILESLERLGFVRREKNQWLPTKDNVHLSNHSWMAAVHHLNWRTKITDQIQFRRNEDLHYTGVHSLSRSDFKKIKERLLQCLVEIDKTIRPSTEEELCCLLVDWTKF